MSSKYQQVSSYLIILYNSYCNVWSTENACEYGSGLPFSASPCA